MVENKLTRAIRELVAAAVKNFALPTKPERGFAEGELRAPQVVNGYLPPKRTGQKDDFPFVLVRADEGATDQDSTEVKVSIIVGTYSEEYDGHEYCLNVMARIRTALCSLPGMVLANRYRLQHPIKWSTYAEQPYPYWQLDMQTTWYIRTPQPIDKEEDF